MADTEPDAGETADTAGAENIAEAVEQTPGTSLTKKLVVGGVATLLLAAGLLAGPAIRGMITKPNDIAVAADIAPAAAAPAAGPELYTSLHPALVVNFRDALGDPHFMQIEMEVMARDQDVINAVREHTPLIRNNLILLYGSARYEDVTTRSGKEQMLADGLHEIQQVLNPRIGSPNVEALYFTSLIIQ